MSELITSRPRADFRMKLLTTASALALLTVAATAARAEEANRPTVWIEGGWHFENVTGGDELFVPPLNADVIAGGFPSVTEIQNNLGKSYGGQGRLTFQPKGTDWLLSVSGSYGRVHTGKDVHVEKVIAGPEMKKWNNAVPVLNLPFTPQYNAIADHKSTNNESHAIIDFQVGKDIGVGLLGRATDSIVSFGAKYAQMSTSSTANAFDEPNPTFEQFSYTGFFGLKYKIHTNFNRSTSVVERHSSFRGIGPSASWSNTTQLFGDVEDGQLAMDWGVNASLLFGRQKAQTHHHSSVKKLFHAAYSTVVNTPVTSTRSRMVTVPNLGGFAGLSYRFTNAKLSAGYRADFFFGAMDRGLDTRKSTTTGFHGPFATISVGLGG